jgi:serine/threonine protein kinase
MTQCLKQNDLQLILKAEAAVERARIATRRLIQELNDGICGYRILNVIRKSSHGTVVNAVQISTQRRVAIKIMPDGPLVSEYRRRRFKREILITSQLQLPNVVRVFDSGDVGGQPYFVMEFIDGKLIDEYVRDQSLSANERVELFMKVVKAVSRAHQSGIIHRDLKPSNILIDQSGEPQILDFGLAKALDCSLETCTEDTVTHGFGVLGTFRYLSPERAMGLCAPDVRGDIYALGVSLFELLAQSPPINVSGDVVDAVASILHTRPMTLKEAIGNGGIQGAISADAIDDDLQAIISKAIARDECDRYQSTAALADDLEQYLSGGIVSARRDQRWYVTRRFLRRHRTHVISASLCLVILSGSAILGTSLWFQAKHERNAARKFANIAYDALDDMVNKMDEGFESLAGGKSIRQSLLHNAEDKLSQMSAISIEDSALEPLSIALLERQGDLARSGTSAEEAEAFYTRAIEAVDESDPLRLARLYRKAGLAVLDGRSHFEKSLQYARRSPDGEAESAETLVYAGRAHYLSGEHMKAREALREAISLLDGGVQNDALFAKALEWDGDVQIKMGNLSGSCDSLRYSLALHERLLNDRSFDVRLRYGHLNVSTKLSTALAMQEQYRDAIDHGRSAVSTGEYLCGIDRENTDYRCGLALSQTRLAWVLRQSGDLTAARDAAGESISLLRAFLSNNTKNKRALRQLGFAYEERSRVNKQDGLPELALEDALEALDIRQAMSVSDPSNFDSRTEFAKSYDSVSSCLQRLERHADAYEHLLEAHGIYSDLLKEQPNVPFRIAMLAGAEINLAAWHIRQKTPNDDDLAGKRLTAAARLTHLLPEEDYDRNHHSRLINKNKSIIDERSANSSNRTEAQEHPILPAHLHLLEQALAHLP